MKNILILLLMLPLLGTAQESERFVRKGLFSSKGTLAIGIPTAYDGVNMYVSGNLEYYFHDNLSYRGGIYAFLGTSGGSKVLAKNHTLFTGVYYHIPTKNHLDPYVGLEPGLSWAQLKKPDKVLTTNEVDPEHISGYPQTVTPIASMTFGVNYFAARFAHIFIEGKYQYGVHTSDVPAVSLSEFKIAFGFGFNLFTIKKK